MKHTFLLICFLCSSMLLFSQDSTAIAQDTNTYSITTFSGKSYIGKILSDDGKQMLIVTKNVGKIYLSKEDVKSITIIKSENEIVDGEYVGGPLEFTTRYIFTTNALPIKKGKNYAMLNIFGPEVHFAVTDRLGVGLMTTWIASPIAIVGKYTFKTEEANSLWNYSIGTILGTSGYLGNFSANMGLHWATATYGNRNNNVSFSGGWSYNTFRAATFNDYYVPGTYSSNQPTPTKKPPLVNGPTFGVSGILKVGQKASFIWDNMLFINSVTSSDFNDNTTNNTTIVSDRVSQTFTFMTMPGMRFEKSDKTAFQLAVAIVAVGDIDGDFFTFPLPMISKFFKF
jgi:hypothetical protein